MSRVARASFALLVISAAMAAADRTSAQGWYGVNAVTPWSMYVQDRVPYFAQHPPVYYSHPTYRPYGYSPYAYPGFVPTPEGDVIRPRLIINPYVQTQVASAPVEASPPSAPPKPVIIKNPFVK